MLISHSHKFITIDIPKTGTRSIRETLDPLGIIDYIGSSLTQLQHGNIDQTKQLFIDEGWSEWESYYKVIHVRNPWARYVSFLNYYREQAKEYNQCDDFSEWLEAKVNQGAFASKLFKNNNDTQILKILIDRNHSQDWYYKDPSDIDYFGTTDTLQATVDKLCERAGISSPKVKHENKSGYSKKKYQQYYTPELRQLVANKEKHVIEQFGFRFK